MAKKAKKGVRHKMKRIMKKKKKLRNKNKRK
jgi:hypothetical protein